MAVPTHECNVCGAPDTARHRHGSYVCPWCGEGVMKPIENDDEGSNETEAKDEQGGGR